MKTLLVVPCYNEELRLDSAAYKAFVEANPELGFLFVNDGSRDGTSALLHRLAAEAPRCTALDLAQNSGKAEAVRQGMLRGLDTGAEHVGFWDADLATPLSAALEMKELLEKNDGLQIVIGSRVRLLGRRIERNPVRHYLGRVFATAVSLLLRLPVYDTQCGAKVFRATPRLREMVEKPFLSRWIFDVELLARFLLAGGTADDIYEHPLSRWMDVAGSKVRGRDFVSAARDLWVLNRAYKLRRLL